MTLRPCDLFADPKLFWKARPKHMENPIVTATRSLSIAAGIAGVIVLVVLSLV